MDYEKLGVFYLGRVVDPTSGERTATPLLYDSRDLVTHAVCVGMTGSGKTGLCISLLEEAAIDGIPAIVIDPKGDLGNLMLSFPDLAPADFAPWVDPTEAERRGMSRDEFAASEATKWRQGLASWDQDGERIRRYREAVETAIYTPGSEAGLPVSILASFAAPPAAVRDDEELLADRVATTVGSILGLIGVDADPLRSREHILLSTLYLRAWQAGQDLPLPELIGRVQDPGVERVGVLDLETFYPARERFELATSLNNLLAAPGFGRWLEGAPLDVDQLLYGPNGKPRVAVFSIAHLDDAERMFFVSLLLTQVIGWMRGRTGTASLRAIVYMDEIFGFLPPVAEPPSKRPFLTLLKQGRAFGVGTVLATQNPVDLDYKALSNAGTWFLGKLQTERDKARVLEGLESIAGGGAELPDRRELDRILSGLDTRRFLMHDVHEDAPVLFETRWAMSYLAGPMTRPQIKRLMDPLRESATATAGAAASATASAAQSDRTGAGDGGAAASLAVAAPAPSSVGVPLLPPDVPQAWLPVRRTAPGELVYVPRVLGIADVRYDCEPPFAENLALVVAAPERGRIDWTGAERLDLLREDLESRGEEGASHQPVPARATDGKAYATWTRELGTALGRTAQRQVFRSPGSGVVSLPDETERDFRVRLRDRLREERDRQAQELREKLASKVATIEEQIRRHQQTVERERDQARSTKLHTVVSVGAAILGAFLGRRRFGATTLDRASSAVRGVSRSSKESQDVERAEQNLAAAKTRLQELEHDLERDIAALAERLDAEHEELERVTLRPKRGDVAVQVVTLAWVPHRRGADGALVPVA